jgi:hypothetical protein
MSGLSLADANGQKTSSGEQSHEYKYGVPEPLLPGLLTWKLDQSWPSRTIGPKRFYFADQGPYMRMTREGVAKLKQVGLYESMIPGHLDSSLMKYFLPENRKLIRDPLLKKMVEDFVENGWPIHSIFYCRFWANPPPSQQLIDFIGHQWIGDGQPETVYRLEPVFHYLKTSKLWKGSSMYLWKEDAAIDFFRDDLIPKLERQLPFIHDPNHQWTRDELRILSDSYCREFYRPVRRPIAFGMYVGNYCLAALPDVVTVGEKGADAFNNARARGTIRQSGGMKFYLIWAGHGPTEKYAYFERAWNTTRGDEWGLPLPHIRYYIFRPYLIGANYYMNEGMPASCVKDIEDDGQYELSTLGLIVKDMLDFSERHPELGVPYSPMALVLDYTRSSSYHGTTYTGSGLKNDDADEMNVGIFDTLFPEHRHAYQAGGYSRMAPYGEIFDMIQPNRPESTSSARLFSDYTVLFALGGTRFEGNFGRDIKTYVRNGGILVLNAADIRNNFDEDFLGFSLLNGESLTRGKNIVCARCHRVFEESPYRLYKVNLKSAKAVFNDADGRAVVTLNRYGKGHVITVLAHYAVVEDWSLVTTPRGIRYQKKALLNFMPHFIEHLLSGLTPIEVRTSPQHRPDLSWLVFRKGQGWVVVLFNYSCERETIVSRTVSTGKVLTTYPLKEVPFQLVCKTPVKDVVEWYEDRDVFWKLSDGNAVVSETIRGGEIRVYELQPEPIDLGSRRQHVNYALNCTVSASSFRKDFPPYRAVDGDLETEWWSETDPSGSRFPMPQWVELDLGGARNIDHIFVLWQYWKHQSLSTRLQVYKYLIETSLDRTNWVTVLDESKNEDIADSTGLERWFAPRDARYVKLTVLRNSALGGARLREIRVMGPETRYFKVKRNPPGHRVRDSMYGLN